MIQLPSPFQGIEFYSDTVPNAFPDEIYEITDEKAKLAVALYREARSLDSVPFNFLAILKS